MGGVHKCTTGGASARRGEGSRDGAIVPLCNLAGVACGGKPSCDEARKGWNETPEMRRQRSRAASHPERVSQWGHSTRGMRALGRICAHGYVAPETSFLLTVTTIRTRGQREESLSIRSGDVRPSPAPATLGVGRRKNTLQGGAIIAGLLCELAMRHWRALLDGTLSDGTFENSGPSPSAIVGCVRMASRSPR